MTGFSDDPTATVHPNRTASSGVAATFLSDGSKVQADGIPVVAKKNATASAGLSTAETIKLDCPDIVKPFATAVLAAVPSRLDAASNTAVG